jgi:hypothetical protein
MSRFWSAPNGSILPMSNPSHSTMAFSVRIVAIVVAFLVLFGATALYYGFTRGESGEWQAGRLPYPGSGVSSEDRFELFRGGRFELQILSACTEQERAGVREDKAAVDLRVVITGPAHFRLDKVIHSVSVGSWGASGRTFSPNEVWALPSGEYEIRIEGHGPVPGVLVERGALIYLERMEDVGPGLGFALAKLIGYCLLATAVLLSVALAITIDTETQVPW